VQQTQGDLGSNLTSIDLSENNIGNIGAKFLSEYISSKYNMIKTLVLVNCKISEKGASYLFDSFGN
jgi:Ran GTPase-activating protein (RanGAP) involved in mRNA processing and transport